jgi:hypothetical protein
MKRAPIFLITLLIPISACTFSAGGAAGTRVERLLPDPRTGLDGLTDYRATLTVSAPGDPSAASAETYTQSVWPALGANFVAYEGFDESGRPLSFLSGDVGDAHYIRAGGDGGCGVQWGPAAHVEGARPIDLASLLLPVDTAESAGEETVSGVKARHYTFDAESLGMAEGEEAAGEVWIAVQGGYVVKYNLQIGNAVSPSGTRGARRIEFLLDEIGARPKVEYPDGCRPVLTEVPAMDDAADIIRLPGMLDYSSRSAPESIAAFYSDYFTSAGWAEAGAVTPDDSRSVLLFDRGAAEDLALVVVRREADAQRVTVSLFTDETAPIATPGPDATPGAGGASNPMVRVVNGLNILLGMDADHPAPPSFHLEAFQSAPGWEAGGVIHIEDRMTADVEGKNVHFVDRETAPDGTVTQTESYLIGDLQYDVEDGVLQPPGAGMNKLAWALWPIEPITILGAAAAGATAAGTETIEGRTAEIYVVDAAGDALAGVSGVRSNITSVTGRVWIDRETGALVKAELEYRADVKDADGKVMDDADGRLEIAVTKIGNVTVELPAG